MTEIVSTFHEVTLKGARYLFLVNCPAAERNEYDARLRQAFVKLGGDLMRDGRVILHHAESRAQVLNELRAKEWAESPRQLLESDDIESSVLIVDKNFDDFHPSMHEWAWITFAKREIPAKSFGDCLAKIANEVGAGRSLLDYLELKRNHPDLLFPDGSILTKVPSKPIRNTIAKGKVGKRGLFDGVDDLGRYALDLVRKAKIDVGPPGWETKLVQLIRNHRSPHYPDASIKTIRNHLNRKRVFKFISERCKSG